MLIPHFDDTHEDDFIHPEQRAKAASKTTWVSVVVNLCLSILQILIGIF
jgi:divalent metal cation (Fe/Co/Zn/Cd) transporter